MLQQSLDTYRQHVCHSHLPTRLRMQESRQRIKSNLSGDNQRIVCVQWYNARVKTNQSKAVEKILYFDIESAPNISYTWGKYDQNVIEFQQESYMLCYAYAWNDGKVNVVTLNDFDGHEPHSNNDKALIQSLWELFHEADIIIAHNAKQFDIKYANGRFLSHGLVPPSTYQVVDTLLIARSKFKLNSNKLNDIAKVLKLGRKVDTGGFELWLGCMRGDDKSWYKMAKYNKQDVVLLREVYYRLRAWMSNHPNISAIREEHRPSCSICSSQDVYKKGIEFKGVTKSQRWKCNDCGANLYTGLKELMPLKNR